MKGEYLLIIDYGIYEGHAIERFSSKEEMVEAVQGGQTFGSKFIMAKEIQLSIQEDSA